MEHKVSEKPVRNKSVNILCLHKNAHEPMLLNQNSFHRINGYGAH